jgi:hypothetical protein
MTFVFLPWLIDAVGAPKNIQLSDWIQKGDFAKTTKNFLKSFF